MIIGVMRISDAFAEHCHETIQPLAEFCDFVGFVTNKITRPEVVRAIEECPNRIAVVEYDGPWGIADGMKSLRMAYELGIEHGAEWVVSPDHDEILPYQHLRAAIEAAQHKDKMVITLPFINCWDNPLTIVEQRLNRTGAHGKLFRCGISDFREDGFCVPYGHWNRIYACQFPLRHCHMMTDTFRQRRLAERGWIEPWAEEIPPTVPFVPEWSIDRYIWPETHQ